MICDSGLTVDFVFCFFKTLIQLHCRRKRQKLEDYQPSKTFNKLTSMVGAGSISVSAAVDLAASIVEDHEMPNSAIKAFSSLGTDNTHPQNAERDLYRWLKNLYNLKLQTYTVKLQLQVSWPFFQCFSRKRKVNCS